MQTALPLSLTFTHDLCSLSVLLTASPCSGVLMWEVYSEGRLPYENRSNAEVVQSLNAGLRLLKPRMAPDAVYLLMEWCWKEVQGYKKTNRSLVKEQSAVM